MDMLVVSLPPPPKKEKKKKPFPTIPLLLKKKKKKSFPTIPLLKKKKKKSFPTIPLLLKKKEEKKSDAVIAKEGGLYAAKGLSKVNPVRATCIRGINVIEKVQNEVAFVWFMFPVTLDSSAVKVKSCGTLLAKPVEVYELQCSNCKYFFQIT